MVLGNWTVTCERMKLEHCLMSYTKINSEWIKDLNVRPETITLLEENIGRTLDDKNQSKILCDLPPRVMEIKTKINKWDLIELKKLNTDLTFDSAIPTSSIYPREIKTQVNTKTCI